MAVSTGVEATNKLGVPPEVGAKLKECYNEPLGD
jgi:hypothetical protein